MPNTKSAERRMRNSARKQTQNSTAKSRLKTLEKNFLASIKAGKKEDAEKAYRDVSSGFDKAAKTGVIHRGTADRKKSRLSNRLAALK
jgi:small subunit ribosomal protein S20